MKDNINIPKGSSLEANKAREVLIHQHMNRYKGKSIKCPALGNIDVEIKQESINETAYHASRSYFSTKAVLDLENQIKTAKLYRYNLPKDNKQRNKLSFVFTIELHGELDGKKTKLLIGVLITARYMHYCLTA